MDLNSFIDPNEFENQDALTVLVAMHHIVKSWVFGERSHHNIEVKRKNRRKHAFRY